MQVVAGDLHGNLCFIAGRQQKTTSSDKALIWYVIRPIAPANTQQEYETISAGCQLYTSSLLAAHKHFACYASTLTVVCMSLDANRPVATLTKDCTIDALAGSDDGHIAIALKNGEVELYAVPFLDDVVASVFLVDTKMTQEKANNHNPRAAITTLAFLPGGHGRVVGFDLVSMTLRFADLESKTVVSLAYKLPLNNLSVFPVTEGGALLLGGLVTGRLHARRNITAAAALLFSDESEKTRRPEQRMALAGLDTAPSKQDRGLATLPPLAELYAGAGEKALRQPRNKSTATIIYCTYRLYHHDLDFATVISQDCDPLSQQITSSLVTVWSDETVSSHDLLSDIGAPTSRRRIAGVRCACFEGTTPGLVAFGMANGSVVFANLSVLNAGGADSSDDDGCTGFKEQELLCRVQVIRGISIIALKAVSFTSATTGLGSSYRRESIAPLSEFMTDGPAGAPASQAPAPGRRRACVIGACADGSFFVLDTATRTVTYKGTSNHTETCMGVAHHPVMFHTVATWSSDTSVKVWRDDADGFRMEQQFGASSAKRRDASDRGEGRAVDKTSGAAFDSYNLLGPILTATWDPRRSSCLMLLSSARGVSVIADVWRGTVYAQLADHAAKVSDNAWTAQHSCLAATVSSDGSGRLYSFERNVQFKPKESIPFERNYVEFLAGPVPLCGVSFSHAAPHMAVARGDGSVSLYSLEYFDQPDEEILRRVPRKGLRALRTIPVPLLGSFAAHDGKPVFRCVFHPVLRDVLVTVSDDGLVKVWSYAVREDGEGGGGVAATNLATLPGHRSRVRPVIVHPELPHILLTGSWDGTVRVWNWHAKTQVGQFATNNHVYGLSISPARPFELLVCGRDLTLRKLFLRGLQTCVRPLMHSCLGGLAQALLSGGGGRRLDTEQIVDMLEGASDTREANMIIAESYARHCRIAAGVLAEGASLGYDDYRALFANKTGPEVAEMYALLAGRHSASLAPRLGESAPPLTQFSTIVGLFYPVDSGAREALMMASFLASNDIAGHVAFSDPPSMGDAPAEDAGAGAGAGTGAGAAVDASTKGERDAQTPAAVVEHGVTHGMALTGGALSWMAQNLGLHYAGGISHTLLGGRQADPAFSAQKYSFYSFSRKLPALKADAFRQQYSVAVRLLAACGDTGTLLRLLRYGNHRLLVAAALPLLDDEARGAALRMLRDGAASESLAARMGLSSQVAPLTEFIAYAQLAYKGSDDLALLRQACYELCAQGCGDLAKVLAASVGAPAVRERLLGLVSMHIAAEHLHRGRSIRAGLEFIVAGRFRLATRIMALAGEAFVAGLLCLTAPEDCDFMGLYGTVELAYLARMSPDVLRLLLAVGRGVAAVPRPVDAAALYLPRWYTFHSAARIFENLVYCRQAAQTNSLVVGAAPDALAGPAPRDVPDLAGLADRARSPRDFMEALCEQMAPAAFRMHLLQRLQGGAPSAKAAVDALMDTVLQAINAYVLRVLRESNAPAPPGSGGQPEQPGRRGETDERHAQELACLYNVVRHREMDAHLDSVRLGCALSMLTGASAAYQAGLYLPSLTLYAGYERLVTKAPSLLRTVPLDMEVVLKRKSLAGYLYSGNSALLASPEHVDEALRDRGLHERGAEARQERCLLLAMPDAQQLRSLFCPFDRRLRPSLTLVPSSDASASD